jgi:hypothetical protein
MAALLILTLLGIYRYDNWLFFPSLDDVRCISSSVSEVYVAVPAGVCVLDRPRFNLVRTLTAVDGVVGEVRLCAYSPARGDVFITTDDRIYRFIPATGRVEELNAPFETVSAIGIADSGAFFATDAGGFFRGRGAVDFAAVPELPNDLTWYGAMDTLNPRDYTFLTPYTVMDDQLLVHPLTLVRPDQGNKRLFVAAQNYGVLVYNMRSGFSENHIRFGPSSTAIRLIAPLDGRLWFVGGQTAVSLDADGDWHYFLTRPGDLSTGNFRLLLGNVTNLERTEGLRSLYADPAGLLLGTDYGVYSLGPNDKLARLIDLEYPVTGMLRLHDSVLFGTDRGLYLASGDSTVEYSDPYGATDWGVFDIARSGSGTAWFGVLGGIVSRTPDGRWFRYVPPGFDLKEPVRSVAAASNYVFMATGRDITVLDTEDNSWTTIDADRGLPVSQVNSLYADDRYLWIAGPGLIARLDYTKELR